MMDCLWFSSNKRSKGWDIQLYRLEYSSNIVQLQYTQHFALTAVGMGILSKKKIQVLTFLEEMYLQFSTDLH